MSARDDGGPAFPCTIGMRDPGDPNVDANGYQNGRSTWAHYGASLRDLFAKDAMVALASAPGFIAGLDAAATKEGVPFKIALARAAWAMADAMLAMRGAK